jgi:hypothetical protein
LELIKRKIWGDLHDEIGSSMEDLRGMTVWEGIQKLSTDSSRLKRDLESLKPSVVLWDDLKIVNNDIANLKRLFLCLKHKMELRRMQ